MALEPQDIPAGTPVVGLNGEMLGKVREAYSHYLLIDQEGQHDDLDVPTHAIVGLVDGKLQLSVNRTALTEVDHEETVHRQDHGPGPFEE